MANHYYELDFEDNSIFQHTEIVKKELGLILNILENFKLEEFNSFTLKDLIIFLYLREKQISYKTFSPGDFINIYDNITELQSSLINIYIDHCTLVELDKCFNHILSISAIYKKEN